MKKSSFSEEQDIGFLKPAEAGIPIKDLCRKSGFSDATVSSSFPRVLDRSNVEDSE